MDRGGRRRVYATNTSTLSITELSEAVDSTAKFGLDLPMGCFELCDKIRIDVAVDVLEYMHETLGEGYAPCPLLEEFEGR